MHEVNVQCFLIATINAVLKKIITRKL